MSVNRVVAALIVWFTMFTVGGASPPMKALIVDGQNNHAWKTTTPLLKKFLEETGLFSVDVATSPEKTKGRQPKGRTPRPPWPSSSRDSPITM